VRSGYKKENWSKPVQLRFGSSVEPPQARLRRDGAIVQLTFDKSFTRAAVTREAEHVKLKTLHC
jgi:hypothetical protein